MSEVLVPTPESKSPAPAATSTRLGGVTGRNWFYWAIAIIVLATVAQHIFMALYPFPLSGHDAHSHLDWIEEFNRLRDMGVAYPRWLPLSFGGFGAMTFYFYPPLTFFLGDFLHVVDRGLSITAIYHLLELGSVLVSIIGMFAYLRENGFSKRASWIAGGVVGTGLYRFWDIFMRNALPEQMAIACIPFILLSIDYSMRMQRRYQLRAVVLAAISWGSLILTNIPTLVLMLIAAPLYGVFRSGFRIRRLIPAIVGAALGALMCSVYLTPILELKQFIRTDYLFDFIQHWAITLQEFWNPLIEKTGKHFVVPLTLLGGLGSLVYLAKVRNWPRPLIYGWAAVGVLALFLQLPVVSVPIWDHFAPMSLIQFSWRWCAVLLFLPAIAIAMMIDRIGTRSKLDVASRLGSFVYVGLAFLWYARYIYIVLTFPQPPPMVDPGRTGAPEHVPFYAYFTSDSKSSIWYAVSRLDEPPIIPDSPDVTAKLIADHGNSRTFSITAPHAFRARFHLYYWPLWKLKLGEHSVPTAPDPHGIMTAGLPAGSYTLLLELEAPRTERLGIWLSLLGISMLTILCLLGAKKELEV